MSSPATPWAPRFFAIWGGQSVSRVVSHAATFALIWWLTRETGSATVLALTSLAAIAPSVLLGPLAGVMVDRWSRRWTMAVSDAAVAGLMSVGAVLASSGGLRPWHIVAGSAFAGTAGLLQSVAMISSTRMLVPTKHLDRIQGANQTMNGALSMAGPALGQSWSRSCRSKRSCCSTSSPSPSLSPHCCISTCRSQAARLTTRLCSLTFERA